jgi:PAS domain S-box-containing protein
MTGTTLAALLASAAAGALLASAVLLWTDRRLRIVRRTLAAVRDGDRGARTGLGGADAASAIGRELDALLDAAAAQEPRLRASEERYRKVIRNLQAAVVIHGADARVVGCNLRAQELLRLAEEQLVGRTALDPGFAFTDGDGVPLPVEDYPASRVLRTGKPLRDEVYGIRRPGAGDLTVIVGADPERDAHGGVAQVIVTFVDITARRNAERALAERTLVAELSADVGHVLAREGNLRSMLQGCADGVVRRLGASHVLLWTHDRAAGVLELQAGAGDTTGAVEGLRRVRLGEGTIGRIAQDREPTIADAPLAADAGWAQRHRLMGFAGYPLVVEGELVGVLAVFTRLPLTGVRLTALAAIANEVAVGIERKLAEEALHRSEERYRRIVETAHEGIWVIDAAGHTTFVNERMAAMLGREVAEMEGASFTDFMDEEARRVAALKLDARRQGVAEQHEFRFLRKDGTEVWTVVETTPFFDDAGTFAGALAMITDLTERRRMEDRLRQSQKLEAVGRLAGGVAHDFNNVLTAIIGAAEDLAARLAPGDPLHEDVTDIRTAAHRAAQLTRQLLAFGRKQATQPRVVDVREIVADMERLLRRLIGENIELSVATEPCPAAVRADPGQLEQIVINLAVNARDAMPRGGRLTIETSGAQLGDEDLRRLVDVAPGDYVLLSVSDTGTGMTPEVMSHLFEPFFTTKGAQGGTGLGLSTVYGIVKQGGGGVFVSSAPARGSTFQVYLPRALATAEPATRAPAGAAEGRGTETILLVEDEAMVRAMAVRVLRRAGYRVLDAGDGEEALRLVADPRTPHVHLLVADVVMPRLGGPDLAARLRATRPELKVLFVSGYTERALEIEAQLGDRTAFLSKPFDGSTLTARVRELLDREHAALRAAAAAPGA